MEDWPDCIVSYLDLVGIKKLIERRDSAASAAMREFHQLVQSQVSTGLPSHQHTYTWNDSVLLIAFTGGTHSTFETIMREVDNLKKKIDERWNSYAISVEGLAFPPPLLQQEGYQEKFVYVRGSSYALTNCFVIERELREKQKPWYVDSRIAKRINPTARYTREMVTMQPTGKKRYVYIYQDYLWSGSLEHSHPTDRVGCSG